MTLVEFVNKIMQITERDRKFYPELRLGQAVFNAVDRYVGVARKVQFDCGIDCFYNDNKIEEFLDKCWEIEPLLHNMDVNEIDSKPNCLAETIPYMMSKDWKMRLLGEYYQLKLRYNYLKASELAKEDDLIASQLVYMEEYASVLKGRIEKENIELI